VESDEKSCSESSSTEEEWREVLDELLDEEKDGNEKLSIREKLSNVIKSGQLDELKNIKKHELYECIYIEAPSLLPELIEIGLSNEDREEILTYGINNNDFTLIEGSIKGGKGQARLDFNKIYDNEPLKLLQSAKEGGLESEIVSFLLKEAKLSEVDLKEAEWRQFLFNFWQLDEEALDEEAFEIKNEKIEYAGDFCYIHIEKFLTMLTKCREKFPLFFAEGLFEGLDTLLKESFIAIDSASRLEKYKADSAVLIHAGCEEHQLDVIFKGKYLLICGMGPFSEVPVQVYNITPEKVDVEIFETLRVSSKEFSDSELIDYFNTKLFEDLDAELNDDLTNLFTENWVGKKKLETQSCVPTSIQTAMSAYTAMHHLLNSEDGSKFSGALKVMYECQQLLKIYSLEDYLLYSSQNISNIDTKLVKCIFEKAKEQYPDRDVYLRKLIDELEHFYDEIIG
jgi:hypothetical protein